MVDLKGVDLNLLVSLSVLSLGLLLQVISPIIMMVIMLLHVLFKRSKS